MSKIVDSQNKDILDAWERYDGVTPKSNTELAVALDIEKPNDTYQQDYASKDIRVKVI